MAKQYNPEFAENLRQSGLLSRGALQRRPASRVRSKELILFRDPARPGFPDVETEMGLVYDVVEYGDKPAAFLVFPVSVSNPAVNAVEHHQRRGLTRGYMFTVRDREEASAMGLVKNFNFNIGVYVGVTTRRNPAENIRVLPVVRDVLDLDEQGRVYSLRWCPEPLWENLLKRIKNKITNDDVRAFLTEQVERAVRNKDTLSELANPAFDPEAGVLAGVKVERKKRRGQGGGRATVVLPPRRDRD